MVWLASHTDPRAISLPFLASPLPGLTYLCAYIAAIYFGKRFMLNRKPYDLKLIIGAYNLLQVVLCVIILNYAFNGGFTVEYIYTCVRTDTGNSAAAMSMVYGSYYTWLLKGFELVETIFFVLRKKDNQVSVLHVYHHISTFVLTWFFARSVAGGMLSFSVVLNSCVHILMYTYYFLALFGAQVQRNLNWLKRCITSVQIGQFLVLLVNGTIAGMPACQAPQWFLWPYILNLLFLLYMFVRFYVRSYTQAKQLQQQQRQQKPALD